MTKNEEVILGELQRLNHLMHNFVILQLIERGLGREDIKKVVKGLNNSDYTAIYGAHKRSKNGQR
jgi:adenylosuccinate lyase